MLEHFKRKMLTWSKNSNNIKPMDSSKLSKFIKIMTYLSILPVVSKTETDDISKTLKVIVEVKKWRALIVVLTDLMITIASYGGVILFNEINNNHTDGLTSFQRLFEFQFYLKLFNGVKTDTLTQVTLWFSPFLMFYPYLISGWTIGTKLNGLINDDKFKVNLSIGRLPTISLIFYSLGWYLSGFSVPLYPRNWSFYLLSFCTLLPGIRYAIFMFFVETLLFGLLKGWNIKRPLFLMVDENHLKNSSTIIEEFKDWVSFYQKIEKCFKTFLFYNLLIMLPMMALYLYLFITQIIGGGGDPFTVYFTYAKVICMILAIHLRHYNLATSCNDAFDVIQNAKVDIIMKSSNLDHLNLEVLHKVKTLESILTTAKPLNGNGYFKVLNTTQTSVAGALATYLVVLIQFNFSEKGGV